MLLPNKLSRFNDTVLKKSVIVLRELETRDLDVLELFSKLENRLADINEYQQALDLLFVLGKVKLEGGKLCYIK